jgi:hypothetical protein
MSLKSGYYSFRQRRQRRNCNQSVRLFERKNRRLNKEMLAFATLPYFVDHRPLNLIIDKAIPSA